MMGGQACVFYGAAEFSRDVDFAVVADPENLDRLRAALADLDASVIAVPPFSVEHLKRGHAIHFRCRHPEAEGLRIDVMSTMRGVADVPDLWERRTTLQADDGTLYPLMALPDLVRAKKTQRDKDWPMIRRLIEADRIACRDEADPGKVAFWLREGRTPALLIDLARSHRELAREIALMARPLLSAVIEEDEPAIENGLAEEERSERALDRAYWTPLKRELEELRHA